MLTFFSLTLQYVKLYLGLDCKVKEDADTGEVLQDSAAVAIRDLWICTIPC